MGAAKAKVLEIGGQVDSIKWDYTGQFLAAAGPGGLTISQYTKSSKSCSDVISTAVPATALEWGPEARTLATINGDGVVTVLVERLGNGVGALTYCLRQKQSLDSL